MRTCEGGCELFNSSSGRRSASSLATLCVLEVPQHLVRFSLYAGRHKWWAMSQCRAVRQAVTNDHFADRGLVSLAGNWLKEHERIWDIGPAQLTLPMG